MSRSRSISIGSVFLALAVAMMVVAETRAAGTGKPNIIFILADDLGYGDLGCYGQKVIQTPVLDRMASEGMKFSQMYAGATVCAPSRCVLMTGKHLGHARVRGNTSVQENQSLKPQDITVAEIVHDAGYATGLIGKWGIGELGTRGVPNLQGFDCFFGYLNQHHAHNYYPEYLFRNQAKVKLRNVLKRDGKPYEEMGAGWSSKRVQYSHDLFAEEALTFVDSNKDRPFFLYLALTIPHANNEASRLVGNGQEVPDYGIYADKDWPEPDKGQAAMITRMDGDIGRLLDRLKKHGIDERTVVMFSSDNGHHDEGNHDTDRFDPNGPLRGMKRDLYEGGIRMPFLVRWPGTTPAGSVSDHIGYFGDLMATAAELAGAKLPEGLDSISLVPTITGKPDQQKQHEFLYWEFYERGGKQAVRQGKWKAVRMPIFTGKTELYDLSSDLGEGHDVSAEFPQVVARMEALMARAHTPDPLWQPRGRAKKEQPKPGDGRSRF